VLAAYMVFRVYYASFNETMFSKITQSGGWFSLVLGQTNLLGWYISQLFLPTKIVIIWAAVAAKFSVLYAAVFLGSAVGAGWLWCRAGDIRGLRLGLAWFLTGFLPLPLMSLLQPEHGLIIEPHWYIFSSVGFFIALAALVLRFWTSHREVLSIVLVVVMSGWLIAGWRMNFIWADEERYCLYWLDEAPSMALTSYHLARVYETQGRKKEAEQYFLRAAKSPRQAQKALTRLGFIHFRDRNYRRAGEIFEQARQRDPGLWENYNNLGLVALRTGRLKEAEDLFRESIRRELRAGAPRVNLARLLLKQGRHAEADVMVQEIRTLKSFKIHTVDDDPKQ
jgi:tetratricopeptide (TPR) repeat protein